MDDARWLDDREQAAWRAFLAMAARLPTALNRSLQADSGLSLSDFDVLVALTDAVGPSLRVRELAESLQWEKSRLSHHLARMQKRGLIARDDCADDGRGAEVSLTPRGRHAIEQAAPGHVDTVRRLVFDGLDPAQVDALEAVGRVVCGRIAAADPPERGADGPGRGRTVAP